jgi:cyclopropane-fatty-acyl-phospholipid synthase
MRYAEPGQSRVELPSGEPVICAGSAPRPSAEIRFRKWRSVIRLTTGGDVGLAASYRDGEWMSSHLPALIEWALATATSS